SASANAPQLKLRLCRDGYAELLHSPTARRAGNLTAAGEREATDECSRSRERNSSGREFPGLPNEGVLIVHCMSIAKYGLTPRHFKLRLLIKPMKLDLDIADASNPSTVTEPSQELVFTAFDVHFQQIDRANGRRFAPLTNVNDFDSLRRAARAKQRAAVTTDRDFFGASVAADPKGIHGDRGIASKPSANAVVVLGHSLKNVHLA